MSVSFQSGVEPRGDALPRCYHCDQPIHGETDIRVTIDGASRPMCCEGCKAVAEAIIAGGLDDYYRQRSEVPARPQELVPEYLREAQVYDHEQAQRSFVHQLDDGEREASLVLTGIAFAIVTVAVMFARDLSSAFKAKE